MRTMLQGDIEPRDGHDVPCRSGKKVRDISTQADGNMRIEGEDPDPLNSEPVSKDELRSPHCR
jgi:hypothetical protein